MSDIVLSAYVLSKWRFKMAFFSQHKRPNAELNFFQNYHNHLKAIDHHIAKEIDDVEKDQKDLSAAILGHINVFDSLRDGYDYFDECLGATVVPLSLLLISLALEGVAVWQLIQSIGIKVGLIDGDAGDALETAGFCAFMGAGVFVMAALQFIKSAVSMITRPIATVINGPKAQDVNRFQDEYHEDISVISALCGN